jgi:HIV Tat-specific factor 1
MFTEKDTADVKFALDLKEDLLEECERLGEVTAVHVLASLLTCTVKFREKEAAAACLKIMNGRYFDGRRISAILYDGSFSLKEEKESKADEERLEHFGEWLESAEQ